MELDRSFVADTARDERSAAIVASTTWRGHRLGVRIVGEGVEDDRTLQVLRELGCDTTQGFLHARAPTAPEFLTWVTARLAGVPTAP